LEIHSGALAVIIKVGNSDDVPLKFFAPFTQLSEQQLILLSTHADLRSAGRGEILLQGDPKHSADEELFLLRGTIEISDNKGKKEVIEGASERSKLPLAANYTNPYKGKCITSVKYLAIPTSALSTLTVDSPSGSYQVKEDMRGDAPPERQLLFDIYEDLRNNKLVMPSLPDVALEIRIMIDQDQVEAKHIANAINKDPAMTAKIIKAANSPLFHSSSSITSTHHAVVRLGLKTTRHLVTSFAIRELYEAKSKRLKKKMDLCWQKGINVGALSFVLARGMVGFDPDQALLGGLLHEIGSIPVLTYAEKYPEVANDDEAITRAVAELSREIGGIILQKWRFDPELVKCAKNGGNWYRDSETSDVCDVVLLAEAHFALKSKLAMKLPSIAKMPAFAKLDAGELSKDNCLEILEESSNEIKETMMLFGN